MQAAIDPIAQTSAALPGLAGAGSGSNPTSAGGLAGAPGPFSDPAPAPFSDLLTDAVSQVNQLEGQARAAIQGLMTGSGVDVHEAMIAEQKADMSFELALSVRNKAVQAYQQVLGMQF